VAVDCDSNDKGADIQRAVSFLYKQSTASLSGYAFLEVKSGGKLSLLEYQTPREDGLGARFVFPRLVDGKPFITPESEEIRFYAKLDSVKLDRRFKTKDMIYEGTFEY
jgi:hypothetical protein